MSEISFSCPSCGQVLEAPAEMAGETTECPACQQALLIPSADPGDVREEPVVETPAVPEADEERQPAEGLDVAAANQCPSCRSEMAPDTVLCMRCGFHTKLGKKISTSFG